MSINQKFVEMLTKANMVVGADGSIKVNGNGAVSAADMQNYSEILLAECAKFLNENSGYDESNNAWHPEPEDLIVHFDVNPSKLGF